jgi:transcriptional regulator with XRE-family HTH domain
MQGYRTLGMKIRLKRIEAGLFQRTLAAVLGISQPHLSWWETGKYKPSAGYLRRLNRFLSLDPMALRVYVRRIGLQPRRRKQR